MLSSLLFGIISPLFNTTVVENKIINIDADKNIDFINRYGNFTTNKPSWEKREKNKIYKDTLEYHSLLYEATNDTTIQNINQNINLSKFQIQIGKNGFLLLVMMVILIYISLIVLRFIFNNLYKFFKTLFF